MRLRLGLSFALFFAVAGCGNNGLATGDDMSVPDDQGTPDLTTSLDLTTVYDLTYFHEVDGGGPMCGPNKTCSPGETCCVVGLGSGSPSATCGAGCVDGGLPIQCNGPAQCGGNPCCLTLENQTPTGFLCTNAPGDCPPMLAMGSSQTRACKYDGDCTAGLTSSMAPTCCHSTANPNSRFCFDSAFVGFTMGQVACP
jgi:hypothetical protein